jgi:putative tryptophan/tyrosine transport system substrate-binding protein
MRRRAFIALMGGLAATTAFKPAFPERSLKLIVWMSAFPFAPEKPFATLFLKGLQEQGYVSGRDFAYAECSGNGIADAARVAEEAIQLKPDIIIASATLEAVAAKNATSTIPIICPRHGPLDRLSSQGFAIGASPFLRIPCKSKSRCPHQKREDLIRRAS